MQTNTHQNNRDPLVIFGLRSVITASIASTTKKRSNIDRNVLRKCC